MIVAPIEQTSASAASDLGSITDTVGHSPPNAKIYRAQRKQDLLLTAKELLPKESRLHACLCVRISTDKAVGLEYADEEGRARITNLITCGNPWICPNCGGVIAERKGRELLEDVTVWELDGGVCIFATHTLQHFQGERLAAVWERLKVAYKKLWDGRPGRAFRDRWNIIGRRRSPDTTNTLKNGWHPHFHVFYFLERGPLSEAEKQQFNQELSDLWRAACDCAGGYADEDHGTVCRFGDIDQAVDYVASKACGYGSKKPDEWGAVQELTKSEHKQAKTGGYNPNELLEMATWGNEWAAALWVEYAQCFKGKKFLDTTRGLRARLDELKEQYRAELDELLGQDEPPEYRQVAYIGPEAWKQIVKLEMALWLLEELKAAEGDALAVKRFLEDEGITQVWYPDLEPDYPDWWLVPEPHPPDSEEMAAIAQKVREFNQFVKDWNEGRI